MSDANTSGTQDTTETATPAPGTPEYDAAMAAKFEGASGDNGKSSSERPDWLPAKYNSVEDFTKAHAALEAKFTQTSQELAALKKGTKAGLDLNALNAEFAQNGALSDDSYKALEAVGINREIVDQYIQGQQAIVEQRTQAGFSLVGGEANYKALTQWGAANLAPAEIAAFNKAVNGTADEMAFAIKSLAARFQAARGANPQLVQGQRQGNQVVGFRSTAEMVAAMSDPKYHNDPAYRKDVEAKVANAQF